MYKVSKHLDSAVTHPPSQKIETFYAKFPVKLMNVRPRPAPCSSPAMSAVLAHLCTVADLTPHPMPPRPFDIFGDNALDAEHDAVLNEFVANRAAAA